MIRLSDEARADLKGIVGWIKRDSGAARARRVRDRILASQRLLQRFPELGRPGRVPGTRELVVRGLPYLSIYVVVLDGIEIARILHGAQQWPPAQATEDTDDG